MVIRETARLILRVFEKRDLNALSAINQDPDVMKYFPGLESLQQTHDAIFRIIEHHKSFGYSFYAVELRSTHEMIGFVGLKYTNFEAHFTPAVEIGWRISSAHWNKGYATEAAKAVIHYAFTILNMSEIVSFTVESNLASRRIMEKIGMNYNASDDFDHPKLTDDSPLKRHVLYRITKSDYLKNSNIGNI